MNAQMVIQWILLVLLVGILISRLLPAKGVSNLTIKELKDKRKDKNIQFIDVRTPQEFKQNNQKPFKNIPLSELANRTNQLKKDREIIVICKSGMRSMRATKILKKQGFEKVSNVKGGMSAW